METTTALEQAWDRWTTERDAAARDELICHYIPMVEKECEYLGRLVRAADRCDLFGFGIVGLIDALDRFDAAVGCRFESYAKFRVRGAIVDGVRTLAWLPRPSRRRPSKIIESVVTVDFQASREGSAPLQDLFADLDGELPSDAIELQADHAEVAAALHNLPARERGVILDYYYGARRLQDIGRDLGVTESRVCQMHRKALGMLRQALLQPLSA